MKKIYFYLTILLGIVVALSSCNDEWEDELYTRMVSLKAPINRDDVSVIYLRYKPDNQVVTFKLPVIVSGSQENNKDYMVRVGVDSDTLNFLNFDK